MGATISARVPSCGGSKGPRTASSTAGVRLTSSRRVCISLRVGVSKGRVRLSAVLDSTHHTIHDRNLVT